MPGNEKRAWAYSDNFIGYIYIIKEGKGAYGGVKIIHHTKKS